MGVERHAYGSVLCISRRYFVMIFCFLCSVLAVATLLNWFMTSSMWNSIMGRSSPSQQGCTGPHCYEVFTCNGLKDATWSIREPLVSLTSAIFFPLGFLGAFYGTRWQLKWASRYFEILFAVYLGILIFDIALRSSCPVYPGNVMNIALTNLLTRLFWENGTRANLMSMDSWTIVSVDAMTHGVKIFAWYLALMIPWVILIGMLAYETWKLSTLVENGPLGLGINYGLDQWDYVINEDAVRRNKEKHMSSQFIDDARLPLPVPPGQLQAPYGITVRSGVLTKGIDYGSVGTRGEDESMTARIKGADGPLHYYVGDEHDDVLPTEQVRPHYYVGDDSDTERQAALSKASDEEQYPQSYEVSTAASSSGVRRG